MIEFLGDEEIEEERLDDDEWSEEDDEDGEFTSFVCEDCDYRWEETAPEEVEAAMAVCPMCGSVNVTQL